MTGIICSAGAALFWALGVIYFKKSGDAFSPLSLNLFKCLVTIVLIIPTMVIMNIPFIPSTPPSHWALLVISGFFGIALADTFFFAALSRLGAGLIAIVDCMYLPSVILLSFFFLNEELGLKGITGCFLVISAIVVGSFSRKEVKISKKDFTYGLFFGFLAIFFIAVGIIIIKEILPETDVIWATFIRVLAGTAGILIMIIFRRDRKKIFSELKPSPAWENAIPASVFANYIALILWLVGMKYAMVSIAAILNQLSAVFIFIFAALILKEKITVPKTVSIFLAFSGAVLAILN